MQFAVTARFAPECDGPEGQALFSRNPTLLREIGQDTNQREGGRDGEALEIRCFSLRVLGYERDSCIEAR